MNYSDLVANLGCVTPPSLAEINWLEREFPDPEDQRKYAQERCIVAVTEALGEAMEQANLSRAALANRLGVTKGYISQVFAGRNLTLRTVADILWACKQELRDLEVGPLGVMIVASDQAAEWRNVLSPSGVAVKASIEVFAHETAPYRPVVQGAERAAYEGSIGALRHGIEHVAKDSSRRQPFMDTNNDLALAA